MTRDDIKLEYHYKRNKILGFLEENGFKDKDEKIENTICKDIDIKRLQYMAIGISMDVIQINKAQTPRLYTITYLMSFVLFLIGFILMFVDPFIDFIDISSMLYIVWCLCCLSMFFTSRIASKDWRQRHGKEKL